MPHESFRVIWNEHSPNHSVIAEQHDGEWRFFDQWEGEVRWYPLVTSPVLITKAEQECARKSCMSLV